MGNLSKVLIMAGGTGGHVFPGLAVARAFQKKNIEVHWLGTRQGLESKLVPDADIPIHFIEITGIRGKGLKNLVLAPWRLMKAVFQSINIIRTLQPNVILGLGGFVSGPGGIAAWLLRYPLVIHEQNAKPGLTNKWLSRLAKKTLEAFPSTFLSGKAITVGNPIRTEILAMEPPNQRFNQRKNALHLLIVGGSLGAAAINQLIPQVLAELAPDERPMVLHQTGEKLYPDTLKLYQKYGIEAQVEPFIHEMDKAYAWADIVLCRAGALTVSELCAAGLGAIFIPYPFAVDDHQTANADFMVKNNAAWIIQQRDLTVQKLKELIQTLNRTRETCFLMAQSAFKSRKIHATEEVLKICEEICP